MGYRVLTGLGVWRALPLAGPTLTAPDPVTLPAATPAEKKK